MSAKAAVKEENVASSNQENEEKLRKKAKRKAYIKRYWQLYALLLLPMVYLFVFKYLPMRYILIAFKDYKFNTPLLQLDWKRAADGSADYFFWFKKAFATNDFKFALRNTVCLNLLDLVIGFPIPIIFALILNELPFKRFKKAVQTIAYMPHFLSWVIIYGLALQLFTPTTGFINMLITNMGGEAIHFLDVSKNWVGTYIFLGVWQSFGWNSIVYLAAIAGISPELYEAASVDGAGRFSKMWHITLPGIKSTIVVLLVMALGNIIGSNFDRPFALQNNLVMNWADVISTYVYRIGIKSSQFSLTTAVGLFQSVVGVFFLLLANYIARRLGERGIW